MRRITTSDVGVVECVGLRLRTSASWSALDYDFGRRRRGVRWITTSDVGVVECVGLRLRTLANKSAGFAG
ncbi:MULTISPECIES: hypothetical protein [Paenibacillus]|uniref:hypothetical protein n=1 Tax=Paenibacillus TaxID=44249 RepID=UPI0010557350|nr:MULTISPECIES: hypothetical protein [Paenibacillus]MEC0253779.1 hypothetical protein [Paenibacillus lautus]